MEPRRSNDHPTFGELLRRYRLASGLTQEQLAERSGVSVRGISDLERGLRLAPRRDTVQLLSRALELPTENGAQLLLASRRASAGQREGTSSTGVPDHLPPLPVPVDRFIGRTSEIESLVGLLNEPTVRLVTITGPGGVGKTRLALEVARQLSGSGQQVVAFISLAQITDHREVLPAIAQAIGIAGGGEAGLMRRIAARLAGAPHLLVLDNFEHLLQAAPLVVDLLEACAQAQILATSRAALGVAGERRFPLDPMQVPNEREPAQGRSIKAILQVDSVQLFVERARSANPGFSLDEGNAAAVADICRHLEGLPLAIELAAARAGALSAHALLESLHPRLQHLTGGYRNRPERLRTMRSAVAWSFELLTPEEQTLFRRLGVFEGGFDLQTASAVVAPELTEAELLERITSLANQSLVRPHGSLDGSPRFRMLETIREFAVEQLELSGEAGEIRSAHANAFLELAQELRPHIEGPAGRQTLERLEMDHGNLLGALSWLTESAKAGAALQLSGALWKFWVVHGHLRLGLERLERALAMPGPELSGNRLEALYGAGSLARDTGDHARARQLGKELLGLSTQLDDAIHQAMAHFLLGSLAALERNLERAIGHFDESLLLFREHNHAHGYAMLLHQRANIARDMGDYVMAESGHREALAIWREREDQWGVGLALNGMGVDAEAQRKDDRAAEAYAAAIDLHDHLGATANLLTGLEGIARLAARGGQPEVAIRLLSAAEASHRRLGNELEPTRKARNDAALQTLRTTVDAASFDALWEEGQALTIDEAVSITDAEYLPPQRPAQRRRGGPQLSRREIEVLKLLATGQTDREIGEVLFISRRTVTTHVTSILNKLGVISRTAAAAVAVRDGIV